MLKLNFKKHLSVLIVISLLFLLHFSKLLNPVESFLSEALSPVLKVFYSIGLNIRNASLSQPEASEIAAKLKGAKETIDRLTAEKAEAMFLREENLLLRQQLNFLTKANRNYLLANIISRGQPGDKDSLVVIDKGLKNGLFPGLAVTLALTGATTTLGVIIGKITVVKDNLSEICLITDKNCKVAAAILGENKTIGVVRGELGLTIKMDFIPQTENIKEGDLVATSGLEQNIPRGLLIGRVDKIEKENNELWQSAIIGPQITTDSLSVVSILLP